MKQSIVILGVIAIITLILIMVISCRSNFLEGKIFAKSSSLGYGENENQQCSKLSQAECQAAKTTFCSLDPTQQCNTSENCNKNICQKET